MFFVSDEFVHGLHLMNGDVVVIEEVEGVFSIGPGEVTGAPVFADEVVLRELVAEVVFDAPSTGHEGSPEGVFPAVIDGVSFVAIFDGRHAGVAGVGGHSFGGVSGFVKGDTPGFSFFLGRADPLDDLPVALFEGGILKGCSGVGGVFALERGVNLILLVRVGVDDEVVIVGVDGTKVVRHVHLLFGGLGVFFTDVPVEREVVAETGDDLAAVKFPFGAEFSSVERSRDVAIIGLFMAAAVVVDFGLLKFKVEEEAFGLTVGEDDIPLVELGAIVMEFVIPGNERPDVITISSGIVGEE